MAAPAPFEPHAALAALPPGRHYGGARDGSCWTMVGRDLREVETWEIVPPAASLTLAWGAGGCTIEVPQARFDVRPGEWMWIDAGLGHRGRNQPGSDFATLFFAAPLVEAACLHLAPIEAGVLPAPDDLRGLFEGHVARLLEDGDVGGLGAPAVDALLDWAGTAFPPGPLDTGDAAVEAVARVLRADPRSGRPLAELAREVGLTPSRLSHRFATRHRLSPQAYRRQLRLVLATRALTRTGSVSAAAAEAGFADTAHLSRTFREQYGITPSEWMHRVAVG